MSVFGDFFGRLMGKSINSASETDMLDLAERNSFSQYLPYRAYDEEEKMFINNDGTIGFIWECLPLSFAGDKDVDTINGLLKIGFMEGTIMQFIVHGDPYIDPILDRYRSIKSSSNNVVFDSLVSAHVNFIKNDLTQILSSPPRNIRLFITIKFPVTKLTDLIKRQVASIESILETTFSPYKIDANELLQWLFRFYNDTVVNTIKYNPNRYMNEQIIKSETVINNNDTHLKVGNKIFNCLTIKTPPEKVSVFQTRQLIGGVWGIISDTTQIGLPFLYATNIIFEDLKTEIRMKCAIALKQSMGARKEQSKSGGSVLASMSFTSDERLRESMSASKSVDDGEHFVKIMPLFWIYGNDKRTVDSVVSNMNSVVFGSQGYEMQIDRGILPALFIASQPFGLYATKKNINKISRTFIEPTETVARVLPYQGGFHGTGSTHPVTIFLDRNGQILGMDLWCKSASCNNGLVCASSGKGKSFFLNYIASRYFEDNARVYILDIGKSYFKTAKIVGARFMCFSPNSDICITPFAGIKDKEEFNEDVGAVTNILMNMIYSSSKNVMPSEDEWTLIQNASKWAFNENGEEADVDLVRRYLLEFPGNAIELKETLSSSVISYLTDCAHKMAFNIENYCSGGVFGRWFNGKTNVDLKNDRFVILEVGELERIDQLFKIITLQVTDFITKQLYLGDRSEKKLIILDEVHLFIKKVMFMNKVVEQIYRRARKHNGGIIMCTQSVLDLYDFPDNIGRVAWNNSAFKFLLESSDFRKAKELGVIPYDEFVLKLLESVTTIRGKYSEIFFDTPNGMGVSRFYVDKYMYHMFSTAPNEVAQFEKIVDEIAGSGSNIDKNAIYDMALKEMIKRHEKWKK